MFKLNQSSVNEKIPLVFDNSTHHVVSHGYGRFFSCDLINSNGEQVECDFKHTDENTIEVIAHKNSIEGLTGNFTLVLNAG